MRKSFILFLTFLRFGYSFQPISSHFFQPSTFRLKCLQMSPDPFEILNIPQATTDKKVIKKAYRRMAMKYHPDVITSSTSTPEEKKQASDTFANINAAYELLMGKASSSSSSSTSSSRSSSSYEPPHRRKSSYQQDYKNWQDFVPKYDDDDYNTDGDSFGAIFSDFVSGFANENSNKGIIRDLVDFLEKNVEGLSSGNYNEFDPLIADLLKDGTLEEVKEELDDTELLIQQLQKKKNTLIMEEQTMKQKSNDKRSRLEIMELEEQMEEILARKKVVEGYITKAKGRLTRLQLRYKEMRNRGGNDSTSYTSTYSTDYTSSRSKTPDSKTSETSKSDWKTESFGSSRRGRGSRRRSTPSSDSSSSRSSYASSSSRSSYTSPSPAPRSQKTNDAFNDLKLSLTELDNTPPHRRKSSQQASVAANKKRLRELQVEDEFEKLKKELGM